MEYQKTNVNSFLGLDSNLRPELIKNEEASDIENLRFDKLGYLVNRNGVENKGINITGASLLSDTQSFLRPIGTMGMVEYVITKPWGVGSGTQSWPPYDDTYVNLFSPTVQGDKFTDRFMVYMIRIPVSGSALQMTDMNNRVALDPSMNTDNTINRYTWRYKAALVMVPLTGAQGWKDTFAFAPNGNLLDQLSSVRLSEYLPTLMVTIGSRSIVRADDKPSRLQIYAPSRWLGVHNLFSDGNTPKDLNWIEQYNSMSQYRDAIVVSDMTNGDMYLVDEYSESEYSENKKHRFTLRENTLAKFDVDDVVVDFGLNSGGFNAAGVKSPMALYKFYLTKNRLQANQDSYTPYYTDAEKSPTIQEYSSNIRAWNVGSQLKAVPKSFIATEYLKVNVDDGSDFISAAGIRFNLSVNYTFTNSQLGEEYGDLFSPLTLKNPDINQDDQVSSDIYKWEDLELTYYPASGSSQGRLFLTAKDRLWNKTSSSSTKLIKLKTKTGVEQDVPLGVWRYRFVWYLGNGEYSAPSSELIVPDLIFSGIDDADVISALGSYKRPFGMSSYAEAEQTSLLLASSLFINKTARLQGLSVFNGSGALTNYGSNFLKVKTAIFDSSHTFGARYSSTSGASWPGSWTGESVLAKGQLGVVCTTMWQNDYLPLEGCVAETAYSQISTDDSYKFTEQTEYRPSAVPLRIPLFSDGSNSCTYNSVFTSYGILRTSYQNTTRNPGDPLTSGNQGYSNQYPSYQIVFEGMQRYGADKNANEGIDNKGWVWSDVANSSNGVWMNIIPFYGGTPAKSIINPFPTPPTVLPIENNNTPDDDNLSWGTPPGKYLDHRNMTVVRGVRKEADRLLLTKPSVPTEVSSRLVLSGVGEIPLCDFGDVGTWVWQKKFYPSANYGDDKLGYTSQRVFSSVGNNVPEIYTFQSPFSDNYPSDYRRFIYASNLAITSDTVRFSNLRVIVSGKGERLTIPEQLSMYIPASLLFEAPHIKLVVPADRVPRRARQLMIFRTRASHDNAWQPHEYGLVKAIDLIRNGQTWNLTGAQATEISFLDDVKSSELDYSYSIPDYDGFTAPLKSRFCLPLNERVFYANIKEAYRPHSPRNAVNIQAAVGDGTTAEHRNRNYGSASELVQLWSHKIFSDGASTTNINQRYLYYFLAYNDQARSFSLASFSGLIDRGAVSNNKPVMFCLPSAYDPSIEQANIYRLCLSAPLSSIPMTMTAGATPRLRSVNQYTTGVFFVAQGLVEYNGVVYYPNSIIQAFHGGDVGYTTATVNFFLSYFDSATPEQNRGNAGTYSQPIIYDITNHLDQYILPNGSPAPGPFIEKIGTIEPESEGVFYDNDLPSLGRLPIKQIFQNEDHMPSAVRWSEPYQQNKIKLASLMEVRAGDGDQITGLAMLYGNLIVLKERSIHRLAVQGAAVPVSRVDEISNNVGCIAPNTIITVNNTLYFLSWAGFYKYDNNVLSKVDGKFAEELQLRLRSAQNGVSNPAIRDASCGWNSTYRELYLTIPIMTTENNEGSYQDYDPLSPPIVPGTIGVTLTDNIGARRVRGITYAINIDNGLVTKHRYMDDSAYHTDPPAYIYHTDPIAPTQRAPRAAARLYYTNTLGQLRSAEVLPPRTIQHAYVLANPNGVVASTSSYLFMRSSMFIESPTKFGSRDKANDDYLVFSYNPLTTEPLTLSAKKFVRVFWASKDWTAEDKSILKRIRKVFAYIAASDEPVVIRGLVHTSPMGPRATTDTSWQYEYVDSRPTSPRFNYSVTGELMSVPTESAGQSTSPSQNRAERHTFNIEGSGSFQMEYFGYYWKPINGYER